MPRVIEFRLRRLDQNRGRTTRGMIMLEVSGTSHFPKAWNESMTVLPDWS